MTNFAQQRNSTTIDLFKWLDDRNIHILTKMINVLWENKEVDNDFTKARVASLFKKGDHEKSTYARARIAIFGVTYACTIFLSLFQCHSVLTLNRQN